MGDETVALPTNVRNGEISTQDLVENAMAIEEAVSKKVAEIGNGATVDRMLALAGELVDIRRMEDTLVQAMANTKTDKGGDDSKVLTCHGYTLVRVQKCTG